MVDLPEGVVVTGPHLNDGWLNVTPKLLISDYKTGLELIRAISEAIEELMVKRESEGE